MTQGGGDRTFRHPWWIVATAAAAGLLAWIVAVQEPVPAAELDLTVWINGAPDALATLLHPVMQVGTIGAPIVVALLIVILKRDALLATAVVVGALVAWFGAKGIKEVVERGRPLAYRPQIEVRDGSGSGFGFISGHSAVAMFTMVALMAVVPVRWRPLALLVALVVGLARVVVGVHLPADVVGGWAFGAILGVATVAVVDRLRPEAEPLSRP